MRSQFPRRMVLATNPELTPNAVKMVLQFTAIPAVDPATGRRYDALTHGTGGLNGQGALDLASVLDATAGYGRAWLRAGVTPQSVIAGESHDWAGSIIWGGYRLRGDGLIALLHPVWHRNIVWGSFLRETDNIVWGTWFEEADNIVWGTNIVWDTALLGLDRGFDIVWGTSEEWDNIVWGTARRSDLDGDNVVWGTAVGNGPRRQGTGSGR